MLALRNITAPRFILGLARTAGLCGGLAPVPAFGFAFMQLFERNKRPEELSPVFKRETKLKGHLKSKATKFYSKKLNTNVRKQKQKLRNHKGLLKRIKIVRMGIARLARDGIGGSNSSHLDRVICTVIKVGPIW